MRELRQLGYGKGAHERVACAWGWGDGEGGGGGGGWPSRINLP